jgi:putative hemolysin
VEDIGNLPCIMAALANSVGDASAGRVLLDLLLIFILIMINGFFAASEMAIVTLNDNKIRNLAESADGTAKKLLYFVENQGSFLATIQVGVTLAGFLSSAFASKNIAGLLFAVLDPDMTTGYLQTISVIIVTIILSYFSLVLGELVPKRIAMNNPEGFARTFVGVLRVFDYLMRPFAKLLDTSTRLVLRLLRIDPDKDSDRVTEEEIRIMTEAGARTGDIQVEDLTLIKNIFAFDDKDVAEIMTPRTNIVALHVDSDYEETKETAAHSRFSRIPVYRDNLDDIVGVLFIKDLLRVPENQIKQFRLERIIREPYFIPESKQINVLFREMQQNRLSLAVVVDEYGGTEGIITIEDLLEEIVGNIEDEYDIYDEEIVQEADGSYLMSGLLTPAKVGEFIPAIAELEDDDDFDTIAGFVLSILGYIPEPGEQPEVTYDNLRFKVLEMDDKRIAKIKLDVLEQQADNDKGVH